MIKKKDSSFSTKQTGSTKWGQAMVLMVPELLPRALYTSPVTAKSTGQERTHTTAYAQVSLRRSPVQRRRYSIIVRKNVTLFVVIKKTGHVQAASVYPHVMFKPRRA